MTATKRRIAALEARRDELAGELEEATGAAQEARSAVVGGGSPTAMLIEPQAAVTALEATLSEMDAELDRLREQAAAEDADADRRATFQAAQDAAQAATAAKAEIEEARATFDRHALEQAAIEVQARRKHEAARAQLRDAVAELSGVRILHMEGSRIAVDPEKRSAVDAIIEELEADGCDLAAVQMALTGRGDLYLDRPPRLAELPTDEVMQAAVRLMERLERRENR